MGSGKVKLNSSLRKCRVWRSGTVAINCESRVSANAAANPLTRVAMLRCRPWLLKV
ncbi:hypothetical protein D3C86_2016510 [compost metagenome]